MTDTIIFYTNPVSRGRIVHWMLEETQAPYHIEVLRLDQGEQKQPAYVAINPMGKVPAIVHRGVIVTETAAICIYLADAFAAAKLAPALDDPARGSYLRWLCFAASCVEPALIDRMLGRPLPERRGPLGYGSYEGTLSVLEQALKPGPFILGERFTAADVYLASVIQWGLVNQSLEPREIFKAYLARAAQRPAFQRALARNQELQAQLADSL